MTLPMGRAMREVFGDTVTELANDDPRIVMLDGDLGSSTKGETFQRAHPERFFQMGIAEQNMLGVAAGMASVGLIPYISTFVAFAVIRPLDQIRVLIAQPRLNVKITGGYSGLFTGRAGKTHQVVDDISIMRAMPNMVIVSPADDTETDQVLRWSANYAGPVYVRLVRDATQHLFDSSYTFKFGAAVPLRDGADVTLISTGAETPRVMDAAEILATRGIQACVLHVPTIKPLDVSAIVKAAERSNFVVTVEEHTVIGGLGGAVAETLSEHRPTPVHRIGMPDVFGESASNDDLLQKYGLSADRVADRVATLKASA
ncbi:MAG: transketolase C-terminal domain-containing protein [Candidatus Dormibacteria bacterium]|jgi:transketolase